MANLQNATFGGGCFWCIEAVIQRIDGVKKVVSGYAGGHNANPTYKEVCSGRSGHAEVIQVTFDADVISFEDLITIFMTSHDPTTLNRQGADRGSQYRSAIFYHNDEQKAVIKAVIERLNPQFSNTIVTDVAPLTEFFAAESYHQNYYNNNSYAGYCRVVIDPKIKKLRDQYADRMKKELV